MASPQGMDDSDKRRKAPLPGATVSLPSKAELNQLKKKLKEEFKEREQMEKRLAEINKKLLAKNLTEAEKRRINREKEIAQLAYEDTISNIEKSKKLEVLLTKEADEERQKQKEANLAKLEENMDKLSEAFADKIANLSSELDSIMDRFLESQESIAYNLNGTGKSFDDINDNLTSALAGTGIVKQENVYKNLQALVEAGIVYDAESRAFLATLSDDLGMGFNMQSAALNRLINLQNSDMADNRMAIQASLKTFLNQNYQTSQYIKEGFESVSEALIESQSFMSSAQASAYEAAVQTWMGSLSSSGLSSNTISSLTLAIDQLGSGNIFEQNGTAMQKLVVLGANRAGLEYGTLMIDGINEGVVNALMGGITAFVNDTIASGGNNVVMSGLALAFGISFADIKAFLNYASSATSGSVTDDINSALLDKTDDYVYFTKKISNMLENFMYQWGTSIASDEAYYTIYKTLETVSGLAAAVLDGLEATLSVFGNGLNIDLGLVARLVPLITALPALVGTGISSILGGNTGAAAIFNALGGSSDGKAAIAGNIGGYSKGAGTSGSAVVGNTDTTDIGKSALTSATATSEDIVKPDEEIFDADDIYRLLKEKVDKWETPLALHISYMETSVSDKGPIYTSIGDVTTEIDTLGKTYLNWSSNLYWTDTYAQLSGILSQINSGAGPDTFRGSMETSMSTIYSALKGTDSIYSAITGEKGVIPSISTAATTISDALTDSEKGIGSISTKVSTALSDLFGSSTSKSSSNGILGIFDGIATSIETAVGGLSNKSTTTQVESNVTVSSNSNWTDDNVNYIKDASTVTALNTQNIYYLLEVWFQKNNLTDGTEYRRYTTNLSGLEYSNYSVNKYLNRSRTNLSGWLSTYTYK